jgi:hypothetical protein
MIVRARAEEALAETHVDNVLELLDTLDDEIDVSQAIDLYLEMFPMDDAAAETLSTRVLARWHADATAAGGSGGRLRGVFHSDR